MTRRRFHIALHWAVVLMILAMVKGGSAAVGLRWAFVATVAVWVLVALVRGPVGRPGPKLPLAARRLYRPMHWGIYALLTVSAGLNAGELLGWIAPGAAWTSLLVLLAVGALHGMFHFWRHTVLMDGALRLIIPRALHHVL